MKIEKEQKTGRLEIAVRGAYLALEVSETIQM